MNEAELRLLSHRATEWGITDDQFEDAIDDVIHGRATLTFPPDVKARAQMLKDMIRMMAADGRLEDPEKGLVALASTALGVDADALNRLIDNVLEEDE